MTMNGLISKMAPNQPRNTTPVMEHDPVAVRRLMEALRPNTRPAAPLRQTAQPKPASRPKGAGSVVEEEKPKLKEKVQTKAKPKAKAKAKRDEQAEAERENRLRELHGRYMAEKRPIRHYAAELGVDQSTLTSRWRKLGLSTRSISEAKTKAVADVGEKQVREIHALYIKHRWSAERAAKEMGVAKHVLRRLFAELRLPRHKTGSVKRLTVKTAVGVYEAYKSGERVADIAARLGFKKCTLIGRWKEAGLAYPLLREDLPQIQALPDLSGYPSAEKRAWVDENLDTVLAAVAAVSRGAVAKRLGIDPFMIDRVQASKESVR